MKKDKILYIIIVMLVVVIVILTVLFAQKRTKEKFEKSREQAVITNNTKPTEAVLFEENDKKFVASSANIYLPLVGDHSTTCLDDTLFKATKVLFKPTTGVLRASLNSLISFNIAEPGEQEPMLNAAFGNGFEVSHITIKDQIATVKFTTPQQNPLKTYPCEKVQFVNQVFRTATQFPSVTAAEIFVNGKSLGV